MINSRRAFTLLELVVTVAIIAILICLTLPAVQYVRQTSRRIQCVNNLKQLGLAMQCYDVTHGSLPLGTIMRPGQPCRGCTGPGKWGDDSNWYPLIFPFIEQQALYDGIDFRFALSAPAETRIPPPGDPLHGNWTARRAKIALFGCPNDGLKENEFHVRPWWARVRGNYVVNFGNTDFGGSDLPDEQHKGAPFGIAYGGRMADIRDGMSSTLLMAEILAMPGDTWQGYVSDFTFAAGGAFTGYHPPNTDACEVVARRCSDMSFDSPAYPCCTVIGRTPDDITRQIMSSRSWHSGGVNAVLCDGSVQFFSDSIEISVWRALASSHGSEAIARP